MEGFLITLLLKQKKIMAIPVKTKLKEIGQTLNVGELIEALSNEIFTTDDAPLSIQTELYSGELVAVFQCEECKAVHLLGNNFHENNKPVFSKEEIHDFLDYSASDILESKEAMTKKDLLTVLSNLDKDRDIAIETMADEHSFTLTGLYKCSEECPAIHLESAYTEYEFSEN